MNNQIAIGIQRRIAGRGMGIVIHPIELAEDLILLLLPACVIGVWPSLLHLPQALSQLPVLLPQGRIVGWSCGDALPIGHTDSSYIGFALNRHCSLPGSEAREGMRGGEGSR